MIAEENEDKLLIVTVFTFAILVCAVTVCFVFDKNPL